MNETGRTCTRSASLVTSIQGVAAKLVSLETRGTYDSGVTGVVPGLEKPEDAKAVAG